MSYRALATQATDITAVLKDNAANPISSATLTFLYKLPTDTSFTNAGNAVTNASGSATLTGTLPAPDQVIIDVQFQGNSIYAASTGEITYNTTVGTPTQTQLTLSVSTPVVSGNMASVNVSGRLNAIQGAPVIGASIQVSLDGTLVGTANPTDSSGAFAFVISGISLGNHTVSASFMGNTTYAASMQSSNFTAGTVVQAGIDPLLIAGIAGVGAVGYVVLRAFGKRKKG